MSDTVEVAEIEAPEVIESESTAVQVSESNDHIDNVIAIAAKIDAYGKAVDTIQNAIIKRSFERDWVTHDREGSNESDRKANIGSAAAERIARFLGIQEKNWTSGEKQWSDDHKHYTWVYEAEFGFQGRWVKAVGRASTRDKFFGYAKGEWKSLDQIKEDDIKQAAFRACRKEGVRTLLGLRNIPVTKLKELGYDTSKIANAGFASKVSESEKATAAAAGFVDKEVTIKTAVCEKRSKDGKDFFVWKIEDGNGVQYSFIAPPTSKRGAILTDVAGEGMPVKITVEVKTINGRDFYGIKAVNGAQDA